jgi:diguanylate cyclase
MLAGVQPNAPERRWGAALVAMTALYVLSAPAIAVVALTGVVPIQTAAGPPMVLFGLVGLAAAVRAATSAGDRGSGRAWWAVAGAFVLLLVTVLLFAAPGAKTTFPAPGDVFRVGAFVLLFVATQCFPRRAASRLERRTSVLDAAIVVAGGAMVLWYLVIGPYVDRHEASVSVVALAAAYPIADLVLVFGFARLLLRGADLAARGPIRLLSVAALCITATDTYLGFAQAYAADADRRDGWQLFCFLSMYYFLMAGALEQCRQAGRQPPPARRRLRVAGKLPYLAVLVGYALMVTAAGREGRLFPWVGLVAAAIGITLLVLLRQVMVQRESDQAAATDGLTGLANRSRTYAVLEEALARQGRLTAVLLIDLNGFKLVNDTLGHRAGDQVLVAVGQALRGAILGSDLAGRLGGDEFAVVLHDIGGPANAEAVARRLVAALAQPVLVDGRPVQPAASIGVAVSAPGELNPDELMHRADVAMYHAKRRGGITGWASYDASMEARDRPAPQDELRAAITGGELRLFYQPIVELPSGRMTGVEALVRWQHPRRGLVGPDAFIPVAEAVGLIGELGRWVLAQACRQVVAWRTSMPAAGPLQLNVNVSPRQLDEPDFSTRALALVRQAGLDPRQLVVEVTESALIGEGVPVAQLEALSAAGIRIALDDFGTGYSSLRYLTELPIDMLKIDRCFVSTLDGTTAGSAVAQAVLRLGHTLGLDTVAEGIETAAQARELTLLGCTKAQGYHFARPMPPEQVLALIVDQVPAG